MAVLWQVPALATQSVTLGWEPSVDPSIVGYNIYYGTTSHVYTNKVSVGNVTNATITGLIEGATYYFAATTDDASGDESSFSNEASYAVPLAAINHPPTLNALANVSLNENAAVKTVSLSGITSGAAAEIQTLTIKASSSNPSLIPNPAVNYTSPNTTGSLSFAPVTYASGTAVITVTVNDGGANNNLVQRTFTVTVNPVNQPPTLAPISNVSLNENAASQTIVLTGISSGAPNENQKLKVTATSSRPSLIANPTLSYTSPNATGSITFKPANGASGTATLAVTVNDGTKSVVQTFTVTVNVVNQPPTLKAISNLILNENAAVKIVPLSGITSGAANEKQKLTVTAVSSNPSLIPNPSVYYTSPGIMGFLAFKPAANAIGSAILTISVDDGAASNNITSQSFTVAVVGTNVMSNAVIAATNSTLTSAKMTIAPAGTYSVIVSNNIAGSTSSPTENLTVVPTPPATLTQTIYENGQYAFYVSGASGSQYVVQASTDLVNWVSMETNTAPFTFVDANASQFSQRFYRAVPPQ